MSIRTATRSLLARRLSVADVIELGLWLAIPYVTIGLGWAFFRFEEVQQLETILQVRLPAGGGLVAYLLVAALWPIQLLLPTACAV
ncbi:hypothetical protein [Mycolicibacterium vaccae]|uniref:Uncharacterized protein n=1 Tax=Mycolicibacterium vaccae ATCC 25954 TaxID=1194972 RepID=K0URG1_MYCVA|nr:hypothetical protein [Mycolicibacterium vaccae]EJZ05203.1 hypothetical protein MVAC_26125 [Mycolicibacterium vaccae ATCC 25954]MCV7062928.1 hypothetical protein [Mycolicibacterium vaccae]